MGRYPLRTAIGEWMNATKDYYSPRTCESRTFILRTLERLYAKAKKNNPELKNEPRNWGEHEVNALLMEMRMTKLSHNSQVHYIAVLRGLLRFLGNGVLDRMSAKYPMLFPRQEFERKPSLSESDLEKILRTAESIGGWRGECIRFAFSTYAYTGLRLSELTQACREDLDTTSWTFRVSHPKGDRSYGLHRVVPIPEPIRPKVQRFLKVREQVLASNGLLETNPLIFAEDTPGKRVVKATIQRWKTEVSRASGVRFTVHSLRRTYGQNLLNRGVQMPTVSLMLGHSSTVTTERHYCRKDADSARLEVVQAFAKSSVPPSVNPPVIERKDSLPGYA